MFSTQVGNVSHSNQSGGDSSLPGTPKQELLSPNNSCLQFQVSSIMGITLFIDV
jgi:hypothetical protein